MLIIPEHELDLLVNTGFRAPDLARAGHVGTGFPELHYGEERGWVAMEDGRPGRRSWCGATSNSRTGSLESTGQGWSVGPR